MALVVTDRYRRSLLSLQLCTEEDTPHSQNGDGLRHHAVLGPGPLCAAIPEPR